MPLKSLPAIQELRFQHKYATSLALLFGGLSPSDRAPIRGFGLAV